MNCNLKEVNLSQSDLKEDLIKRGEIMHDLEEEMRKLKSKYFLGNIKEDLVYDRDSSNHVNEEKKKEDIEGEEGSAFKVYIESERKIPDENIYLGKNEKDFGIRIKNSKNNGHNNVQPSDDNFRLSFNFDNRENHQVEPTQSNRQEFKLDAFDKAKEKLLQIKNELDDMDRYDFRSSKFAQSKRECEINPALKENPSDNITYDENHNKNEYNPSKASRKQKSKEKSKSPLRSNNIKLKNDEKEIYTDKYFKKMRKEYNPNYTRDRSKEKLELIKAEQIKKFKEQYTFRPNTGKPKEARDITPESTKEFFKRLSTPKISKKVSGLELTLNNINNNISQAKSKSKSRDHSTTDRLFNLAKEINIKKESLMREYEENNIKSFSFKPKIDEYSKNILSKTKNTHINDNIPLYERYEKIVEQKQKNICKLRKMNEKSEDEFYKPKINKKSLNKSALSDEEYKTSIYDRLHAQGMLRDRSKSNKLKKLKEEEDKLITFTPKLYSTINTERGNIFDFLKRQKSFEEIKEKNLEKNKLNPNLTFSPHIDPISDYISKEVMNRNTENKFQRLYKDFNKIQTKKENLEKFYYSQFDFKPKINDMSKIVGADNSLDDLAIKKESKRMKEIKRRIFEEELSSRENFHPKINNDRYEKIQSTYKMDEDIMKNIKEKQNLKEEKLNEIKNVVNANERKECKFQPEINKEVLTYENIEPIRIKGLSKHLEMMDMARKSKLEKDERQRKAFATGKNWRVENCVTVPKPFKLSNRRIKDKKNSISPNSSEM